MGLADRADAVRGEDRRGKTSRLRTIGRLAGRVQELARRHRVVSYLVVSTAITAVMVVAFLVPALMVTWWLLAYLLVGAACFLVLSGIASRIELAFAGLAWVFVTAFLAGLGSYDAASAGAPDDRLALADKQIAAGTVVRVSSNYVFLLVGQELTVVPIGKIERIHNGAGSASSG